MNNRIEHLLQFLKEDPNDPFTKYALGTEYLKLDKTKAKVYFEELLAKHEEYVGTYYHAAHLYVDLGMNNEAKEVFEKGIQIAERLNNTHAARELKTAYQNFQFENDL